MARFMEPGRYQMSNQIELSARNEATTRLSSFTRLERESGIHPAIRALHRRARPRDHDTNHKTIQFARIARGHEV